MKKIEELKLTLEEEGVEPSVIDELVKSVSRTMKIPEKNGKSVEELKTKIIYEKDWKKRSRLVAQIISLNLE